MTTTCYYRKHLSRFTIMKTSLKNRHMIAYFSMEVGLDETMPTYSGGLGVLAGDLLKSCADLEIPVVAVSLINGRGFFSQGLDSDGSQTENEVLWDPAAYMTPMTETVTVPVEGRDVFVKSWRYELTGVSGYKVPVIFLDTNHTPNREEDREITARLYGSGTEYRLKQEIVLGIGGLRMLEVLGYEVKKYHMNEGHSSLLTLELLKRGLDARPRRSEEHVATKIRSKCIFTTHTPVEAGHDKFPYDLVGRMLGDYMDVEIIKRHCCVENLNMTLLGFSFSNHINGVAKKHAETSKSMFPTYSINSVTNGVHADTWTSDCFKRLYDEHMPNWRRDPFLFRYAVGIPDEDIWSAHTEAKRSLIDYVNKRTSAGMKHDVFTVGFARRMTEYKRPTLIFSDIEKLKKIARKCGGMQLIFSGKAHPDDTRGKDIIREIHKYSKSLLGDIRIAFIPDYNMGVAKKMVSGCDLWLNTPKKPMEASGTSGMKATFNGVLNLSVLDGWWIEGYIRDVTGWAIGEDPDETEIESLYNKLEDATHTYGKNRKRWINMMRSTVSLNASFFNSHRTMHQYITDAYWN